MKHYLHYLFGFHLRHHTPAVQHWETTSLHLLHCWTRRPAPQDPFVCSLTGHRWSWCLGLASRCCVQVWAGTIKGPATSPLGLVNARLVGVAEGGSVRAEQVGGGQFFDARPSGRHAPGRTTTGLSA